MSVRPQQCECGASVDGHGIAGPVSVGHRPRLRRPPGTAVVGCRQAETAGTVVQRLVAEDIAVDAKVLVAGGAAVARADTRVAAEIPGKRGEGGGGGNGRRQPKQCVLETAAAHDTGCQLRRGNRWW